MAYFSEGLSPFKMSWLCLVGLDYNFKPNNYYNFKVNLSASTDLLSVLTFTNLIMELSEWHAEFMPNSVVVSYLGGRGKKKKKTFLSGGVFHPGTTKTCSSDYVGLSYRSKDFRHGQQETQPNENEIVPEMERIETFRNARCRISIFMQMQDKHIPDKLPRSESGEMKVRPYSHFIKHSSTWCRLGLRPIASIRIERLRQQLWRLQAAFLSCRLPVARLASSLLRSARELDIAVDAGVLIMHLPWKCMQNCACLLRTRPASPGRPG